MTVRPIEAATSYGANPLLAFCISREKWNFLLIDTSPRVRSIIYRPRRRLSCCCCQCRRHRVVHVHWLWWFSAAGSVCFASRSLAARAFSLRPVVVMMAFPDNSVDSSSPLLSGIFHNNGKKYVLSLTSESISWKLERFENSEYFSREIFSLSLLSEVNNDDIPIQPEALSFSLSLGCPLKGFYYFFVFPFQWICIICYILERGCFILRCYGICTLNYGSVSPHFPLGNKN